MSGEFGGHSGRTRKPHSRISALASSVCSKLSPSNKIVFHVRSGYSACMKGPILFFTTLIQSSAVGWRGTRHVNTFPVEVVMPKTLTNFAFFLYSLRLKILPRGFWKNVLRCGGRHTTRICTKHAILKMRTLADEQM